MSGLSEQQQQQQQPPILKPAGLVGEQMLEYLLTELSTYAAASCVAADTASEEHVTFAAEMAAAKLERLGWSVGYRWTERLAQYKTWNAVSAPPPPPANNNNNSGGDDAAAVAAQQLEAVKFLCKEVWMEIFRKPIDKLQTNHRGDLKWLTRFPAGTEESRVAAMRFLAFPCGLIRGALANLGIPAVVSCDFLADGKNMSACNFNIKVK
jgi:trafficking protein particle complex subunit 6